MERSMFERAKRKMAGYLADEHGRAFSGKAWDRITRNFRTARIHQQDILRDLAQESGNKSKIYAQGHLIEYIKELLTHPDAISHQINLQRSYRMLDNGKHPKEAYEGQILFHEALEAEKEAEGKREKHSAEDHANRIAAFVVAKNRILEALEREGFLSISDQHVQMTAKQARALRQLSQTKPKSR